MVTSWIPTVRKIVNGEQVSAENVNPITEQLANRDQYLLERFDSFANKSVLSAYDIPVKGTAVQKYSVVYYNTTAPAGLDLAQVGFSANVSGTLFTPLNDSFIFGIVKSNIVSGKTDIYLQGLIEESGIVTSLLQSSETGQTPNSTINPLGPLYLSKVQPGKLTSVPGGLSLYVGYAVSPDKFFLHTHTEGLNQFFFNYKFNILDRPIGNVSYSEGNWEISNPDLNKVGWAPVSSFPESFLRPIDASFFYNIPANNKIDLDDTLSLAEKNEAKELRAVLPPYPEHYTNLTVNGVVQKTRDTQNPDGKFEINNAGLWWIGDGRDQQPWASDILDTVQLSAVSSTGIFTEASPSGLVNGDKIQLSGGLPTGTDAGNYYYVVQRNGFTFKLASSLNGTPIDITTNGTVFKIDYTPNIWNKFRGSDHQRTRILLQFVKINPDYKLTTVTSIQSNSPAVSFFKNTNPDEKASTGDVLLVLKIASTVTGELTSPRSVKEINFEEVSGKLEIEYQKTVNEIRAGSGIIVSNVAGVATVSSATANFSGVVTDFEPENTRFEMLGLHSYINFTDPASTLANGLVGKFLLPANLPAQKLQFILSMFSKGTGTSSYNFKFEYALSSPNVTLNDNRVTNTSLSVSFPTGYTANTCMLFSPSDMSIPATSLKDNAYVNFRLERLTNTNSTDVGLIGISWKLV